MREDDQNMTLISRLRWLMFFRVVTTTVLLGTTIMVQLRQAILVQDTALVALYGLIGFTYFLTVVYATILPRFTPASAQAYIQIIGDMVITTVVIYLTGGLESIFSFMYILAVINAGILLKKRGGVITASMAIIFYGTLLDLHYYGYLHPYYTRLYSPMFFRPVDVLFKILINACAFYLVAFLTGYLSQQAEESRLKLEAKQSDLERLEDLNESIIRSIATGLMTLGPGGEIFSLNPAGERILGLEFAAVKGRKHALAVPQLEIPRENVIGTGLGRPWNKAYVRADGEKLYLELALLSLRDRAGAPWGNLLVFQDKTRIRQMEEEVKRVEKLAVVGELAAGIAHEIRNPLASLSGSFQMLEADLRDDPFQNRLITIIRREVDHLSHIVNDFLLFARPRSSVSSWIDLSGTIEENLRMFEHQFDFDGRILVTRDLQPGVKVLFDPHQLEQIMWNLLRNAAEAMPGGGSITVKAGLETSDQTWAVVTVADTGQGVAPEDLPKIFDPFFTTKARGSGLGLSIVSRILEDGGGRIRVTSRPGRGTVFTIHLPVAGEG